jgi:hypothetical protein
VTVSGATSQSGKRHEQSLRSGAAVTASASTTAIIALTCLAWIVSASRCSWKIRRKYQAVDFTW